MLNERYLNGDQKNRIKPWRNQNDFEANDGFHATERNRGELRTFQIPIRPHSHKLENGSATIWY